MEESLLFVAADRYSHARHFELGWSKMISTVVKYMNFAHWHNTLLSGVSKKNHGLDLLSRIVATTVVIVIGKILYELFDQVYKSLKMEDGNT